MKRAIVCIALAASGTLGACGSETHAGASMTSGKPGAGSGPSTVYANAASPGPTSNKADDSTQNNVGPNAGGPH